VNRFADRKSPETAVFIRVHSCPFAVELNRSGLGVSPEAPNVIGTGKMRNREDMRICGVTLSPGREDFGAGTRSTPRASDETWLSDTRDSLLDNDPPLRYTIQ